LKVGFTRPIVVDELDQVLAGHGALEAARKIKLERIPVSIVSHLSAAEKRAYMLADNRLAEKSEWHRGMLAEELSALDLEKFDFTMTGFSDGDLEQLLDEMADGAADRSATKPEKGSRMSTEFKPTPPAAAAAPKTVDAASDARTVNSVDAGGNVMRHAYRVLTEDEKKAMVEVKDLGLALWNRIHAIEAAGSRELSVAKTKVEEAVMWATKHLTK
jgi:hypothetical protein